MKITEEMEEVVRNVQIVEKGHENSRPPPMGVTFEGGENMKGDVEG